MATPGTNPMGAPQMFTPGYFNTDPNSGWQRALGNQQQNLLAQQVANQYKLGTAGLQTQLQGIGMQTGSAQQIAAGEQAGQTQRTGMQTASAENIVGQQVAGMLQNTQAQQAGETQRTNITTQEDINKAIEVANRALQGTQYSADQSLAGTRYSADQSLAGTKYTADLTQGRFNTLLPMLQGDVQQALNTTGNGSTNATADLPQAPYINTAPVYSPAQIQQQANLSRANTNTATASQQRAMQRDLAGRGFGANSPLAKELGTQMWGQGLAANTAAENNLRFQAAQANADQVLKAQQAQSTNWQSSLQALIEQQKTKTGLTSALIQALSSMAH